MEIPFKAGVALAVLVTGALFAGALCYSLILLLPGIAAPTPPPTTPTTASAAEPTVPPAASPTPLAATPMPPVAATAAGGVVARNGLKIELAKTNYNGWPLIKAQNQFNDPPLEGMDMLLLTLRVTNESTTSDEPVKLWDSDFKLIGDRNQLMETFQVSCGVLPDELHGVVPPGGTLDGNICFQVSPAEADFQLIYQPRNLPPVTLPVPNRDAAGRHPVEIPPPLSQGDRQTGNGLSLSVINLNFDAWPLVQAQNPNNEPPPEGRAMLLITVRAENSGGTGDGYPAIRESDFRLVNGAGEIFTTFNPGCGVIPDELDTVVARGEAVDGNLCFEIPAQPDSYELLYELYNSPPVLLPLPANDGGAPPPRK